MCCSPSVPSASAVFEDTCRRVLRRLWGRNGAEPNSALTAKEEDDCGWSLFDAQDEVEDADSGYFVAGRISTRSHVRTLPAIHDGSCIQTDA